MVFKYNLSIRKVIYKITDDLEKTINSRSIQRFFHKIIKNITSILQFFKKQCIVQSPQAYFIFTFFGITCFPDH